MQISTVWLRRVAAMSQVWGLCALMITMGLLWMGGPVAAAESKAPALRFHVYEFVVTGNTALPPELVETTLQPFMGEDRTLADVEAARQALERIYQDAGFLSVVVSLPNQRIGQTGEVRLEVTEARIEKMQVTGAAYHRPSVIREQLPSLKVGELPYFPQVQQELSQAQTGHLQLTPLLSAGSQSDAVHMEVRADDRPPVVASVELDNRQSVNTSRGRLSAVVSHLNLFQRRHRLGLSWQYAPWRPADANTLSLMYGVPIGEADDLSISLTRSDSDTPITVGSGGNTITRGEFVGVQWTRELPARQWPIEHRLTVGFDHKRNRDKTQLRNEVSSEKPPLRYSTLSLGYSMRWLPAEGQVLQASTQATYANEALAGREVNCDGERLQQFACKRSGVRPDFLTWALTLDWSSPLWGALQHWRVHAMADAQIASGPLVSGEQYSLGGADTVRGYFDYEQSGDRGWRTRLELISPTRALWGDWRVQGLAFWDRGFVAMQQALEGQVARAHLGSVGLGLRSQPAAGLSVAVDIAKPNFVTTRAETAGPVVNTHKRWRAHVSARQAF